jgi:hemerythrin-like domain-containing protein
MSTTRAAPAPGFDDPVARLADCHRGIERALRFLETVTAGARGGSLNTAQREALTAAVRHFRDSAPLHARDEEDSLFPRLRASGGPWLAAVLPRIETLRVEHAGAAAHQATLAALGARWLAEGSLPPDPFGQLERALDELRSVYPAHLTYEEAVLFPLARAVLSPADLEEIGREMAVRRHLDPEHPLEPTAPDRSQARLSFGS